MINAIANSPKVCDDPARRTTAMIVQRTGDRPLSFTGDRIGSIGGEDHGGRNHNRWYEIQLFKTNSGKYVLAVEFCSKWKGEESGFHWALVGDSQDEISKLAINLNPVEHEFGFPPVERFEDKQRNLEANLTDMYDALISKLFLDAGFAEEI